MTTVERRTFQRNPAEWLKDYRGPVSIVLACSDEVIPSDLGRKLHDDYAGPKRLQVIEGAHHNDIAEQSMAWWKEVLSFSEQNGRIKCRSPMRDLSSPPSPAS